MLRVKRRTRCATTGLVLAALALSGCTKPKSTSPRQLRMVEAGQRPAGADGVKRSGTDDRPDTMPGFATDDWRLVAASVPGCRAFRNQRRSFRSDVSRGGSAGVRKSFEGDQVIVSARVTSPPEVEGAAWGCSLETGNGGVLRIERARSGGRAVVRFSAEAAGKPKGAREQEWPESDVVLTLARNGLTFVATATSGDKTERIGTLEWPGLSLDQELGIYGFYKGSDTQPAAVSFHFSQIKGGLP